MPEIIRRKSNAKLLLLGEGEDRPKLEGLIRELDLERCVIMTGNVRNVPDYLSAMDVFAFPSLFEGMPLSILEVQANGLPCVLSNNVPEDVYLTDLIRPIPLDRPDEWVREICSSERNQPLSYACKLNHLGLDVQTVMERIRQLYNK